MRLGPEDRDDPDQADQQKLSIRPAIRRRTGHGLPAVPESAAGLHHSGQADAGQWHGPLGRLTTHGSA